MVATSRLPISGTQSWRVCVPNAPAISFFFWSTAPTRRSWGGPFLPPMGTRTVIGEFTMTDVVTISATCPSPAVQTYMTVEAAA
jgi:hypothetical protein